VIIANEYNALLKMEKDPQMTATELEHNLALNSARCSVHGRMQTSTNYSFDGALPWQGRWCEQMSGPTCNATKLLAIGDKKGGASTRIAGKDIHNKLMLNANNFMSELPAIRSELQRFTFFISMPVRTIHVLRNPFDMTAIDVLLQLSFNIKNHNPENCTHETDAYAVC
jgi:hypothetical protein